MAACGGGPSSNAHPLQEPNAMRRKAAFREAVCSTRVGGGVPLRAAIGEPGLGRQRRRWAVTWPSSGERPDGSGRIAATQRRNGTTAAMNAGRSRSPLNAVSGWKLGLQITNFARFINSEIALLCGRQGAATHGDLLVGSGGTDGEIARLLEGGFVGRALRLHAQRAALEPLDPCSGDRLVGTGAPPRADRAITRRRSRRPRAWGEARGPRTTQPLPLRPRTRGGA
jgi:hypothetical protein